MSLSDIRQVVEERVRDTAGIITPAQRGRAIDDAVTAYSRVRPRPRIQTITGDGIAVTFALAADFEESVSRITAIEYPVDRQEPEFLDASDYQLYRDPTTAVLKLRLLSMVLGSGVKAYLSYPARHILNEGGTPPNDTIPVADRGAVAYKAASILFRELAGYAAQTTQATLTADSVDRLSQVERYLALAKECDGQYARALGMTLDGVAAASVAGDLDVDMAWGGDRFFHPRRWR
jgi:hypothetical protein